MISGGLIVSNIRIGRGKKGSSFWLQTLTTIGKEYLNSELKLCRIKLAKYVDVREY